MLKNRTKIPIILVGSCSIREKKTSIASHQSKLQEHALSTITTLKNKAVP
jgi:hypothetical protein